MEVWDETEEMARAWASGRTVELVFDFEKGGLYKQLYFRDVGFVKTKPAVLYMLKAERGECRRIRIVFTLPPPDSPHLDKARFAFSSILGMLREHLTDLNALLEAFKDFCQKFYML